MLLEKLLNLEKGCDPSNNFYPFLCELVILMCLHVFSAASENCSQVDLSS